MKRRDFYNNGDNFVKLLTTLLVSLGKPFTNLRGLSDLSYSYFNIHSPYKTPSAIFTSMRGYVYVFDSDGLKVYANGEEVVADKDVNDDIASHLYSLYSEKWESRANALLIDYDLELAKKRNRKYTPRVTTTNTNKNYSNTTSDVKDSDSTRSVYGFNSSTAVPADKSEGSSHSEGYSDGMSTNTVNYDGENNEEYTDTGGDVDARIRKRLRLRLNNIYEIIRNDIDKALTSPIYERR
jgi:hypothetical protein